MKSLIVIAAAALALPAQAALIVDQSNLWPVSGVPLVGSSISSSATLGQFRYQAQSLTAGTTGLLATIDLQVSTLTSTADLEVAVARGVVGSPDFAVLGWFTLPSTMVPSEAQANTGILAHVDVRSLGLIVRPGTVLSIGLLAETPATGNNRYLWMFGESPDGGTTVIGLDSYAGGYNQVTSDSGATWLVTGIDRGFRTWVDDSVVPEPSTWSLMIAGFAMTGAAVRRRVARAAN